MQPVGGGARWRGAVHGRIWEVEVVDNGGGGVDVIVVDVGNGGGRR